jgi:hypothetical protein
MKFKVNFSAGKGFARRLRNRAGQFAGGFKRANVRGRYGRMKVSKAARKARAIGMGAYSAFRGSKFARGVGRIPNNLKVASGIVAGAGFAGLAVKSWLEQRRP